MIKLEEIKVTTLVYLFYLRCYDSSVLFTLLVKLCFHDITVELSVAGTLAS